MRFQSAVLATLLAPAVLVAQSAKHVRPVMPAGADTNDAQVYFDYGVSILKNDPEKAAEAFYWSSQIDPAAPEGFYARRVALLMAQPNRLVGYWDGERKVLRDKSIMAADSLYLHALQLNPFFYRRLDAVFFDAVINQIGTEATPSGASRGDIDYAINQYLAQAPADLKAWQAYSTGQFDEALKQYGLAVKKARKKAGLRMERGRVFYQLNMADSSMEEIKAAAEELRKADAKDLVFVYDSKAVVEQALGMSYMKLGKPDLAKEAFAKALQEDLTYGPAHVQLGMMALDSKDTTAAVSEFDLATQIQPKDASLRYQYGFALATVGKNAEAEKELREAISLAPVYAAPHFMLAKALNGQGKKADAAASLKTYLSLASRNDPRRAEAQQLLASLGSGS